MVSEELSAVSEKSFPAEGARMADQMELAEEIRQLKKQRNAVILAHNYQLPEIQDVADFLGDSLDLSRQAAATEAEVIIFCGVHFMAQTAKLLSPDKTVLMPDSSAGCPLADMITPESLREFRQPYPDAPVVSYVNTTAEVKAESDICCTSSNSVRVVESLDAEEVLFTPDANLGDWTQEQLPDKQIIIYPGHCHVHILIRPEMISELKQEHPQAVVVAHPECIKEVRDMADVVTSTGGMVRFARESDAQQIIVGTEQGLCYRLRQENPEKTFYEMAACLREMTGEITIPPDVAEQARQAVERMVAAS